jgi:hypothetical protein
MSRMLSAVQDMRESDVDEWRVEWDDGSSRTTSLVGLAYYAREWDDEATVKRVE